MLKSLTGLTIFVCFIGAFFGTPCSTYIHILYSSSWHPSNLNQTWTRYCYFGRFLLRLCELYCFWVMSFEKFCPTHSILFFWASAVFSFFETPCTIYKTVLSISYQCLINVLSIIKTVECIFCAGWVAQKWEQKLQAKSRQVKLWGYCNSHVKWILTLCM